VTCTTFVCIHRQALRDPSSNVVSLDRATGDVLVRYTDSCSLMLTVYTFWLAALEGQAAPSESTGLEYNPNLCPLEPS
jgi:hypothetical protein